MSIKAITVWAKDYQTPTGIFPGEGTLVKLRSEGHWNMYGPNDVRYCDARGGPTSHADGKKHWPIDGAPEGALLVWFGGQVAYYPWTPTGTRDECTTQFHFRGDVELQLGPNDNDLGDNATGGALTVTVEW